MPEAEPRDLLVSTARALFFLGVAGVPVLSVRLPAGVAPSDVLFVLSALALALAAGRRSVPPNGAWQAAALLTLVAAALASIRTAHVGASWAIEARMLFLLLIWQWQARVLLDTRARLNRAAFAYAVGAALSGVVAIAQTAFGMFVPAAGLAGGRALGLTGQPNDTGGTLALGVVLGVAILIYGQTRARLMLGFLVALAGIGLILSGSVTGMLATLAGLAVLAARRGVTARALATIVLVVAVAYVGGTQLQSSLTSSGYHVNPLARLTQTTGGGGATAEQNTLHDRIETDKAAWSGIQAQPIIGAGLDAQTGTVWQQHQTHNFLLLSWFQGGFAFLLAMLVAVGSALRRGWSRKPADGTREVFMAGAIAMCVFAMTAPILYHRYFWLPLVLLLAWGTAKDTGTLDRIDTVDAASEAAQAPRPARLAGR